MRRGAQAGEAAMPTNPEQVKASSAAAATGVQPKERDQEESHQAAQGIEREVSWSLWLFTALGSFRSKKRKNFI